uniref:Uncharacterized protein n=1 Tax=viral metagenome TaxID=1070528 RepID=A0A6C0E5J1_9ZZZZ
MNSQNNSKSTIVHRSVIKLSKTLLRDLFKEVNDPELKTDIFILDNKITKKALKYLSLISPQLVPFAQAFNFLLLIANSKFTEFYQTKSEMIEKLEKHIFNEAVLTLKALHKLCDSNVFNDYYSFRIGHFCQRYITFCGVLNYWEQLRLELIMKVKAEEYWTHKNNNDVEKSEAIKKELDSLGVGHVLEQFKPIQLNPEDLRETFHKAFWDSFQDQIKNKNFERVIDLLDEFKTMIYSCYPSRVDKHNEIEKHLDSELIKQMIKNNAIDINDIRKMSFYILNLIKDVQKPADDEEWGEWYNQVELEFKMASEDLLAFWTKFFPEFFRKVFERMTVIQNDIEEFKKTAAYEHIKNSLK